MKKSILISSFFLLGFLFLKELGFLSNNVGNNIVVSGNQRLSAAEVIAPIKGEEIGWIGALGGREIKRRISKHPWIESVHLDWDLFPPGLNVRITESIPWLVAEFSSGSWLISRNGFIILPLSKVVSGDLVIEASKIPRLSGLEPSQITGEFLSAEEVFRRSLEQVNNIDLHGELPFEIERYNLTSDSSLELFPQDYFKYPLVRLFANDSRLVRDTFKKLSSVLQDLELRKERAKSIDLRYLKQAVVDLSKTS